MDFKGNSNCWNLDKLSPSKSVVSTWVNGTRHWNKGNFRTKKSKAAVMVFTWQVLSVPASGPVTFRMPFVLLHVTCLWWVYLKIPWRINRIRIGIVLVMIEYTRLQKRGKQFDNYIMNEAIDFYEERIFVKINDKHWHILTIIKELLICSKYLKVSIYYLYILMFPAILKMLL